MRNYRRKCKVFRLVRWLVGLLSYERSLIRRHDDAANYQGAVSTLCAYLVVTLDHLHEARQALLPVNGFGFAW